MIKFKIDEAHGVVIAYYEIGKDEFEESLNDMLDSLKLNNDIYIDTDDLVKKTLDEVVVYVGRARLHPQDTWDVEKGKELAIKDLHNRFNKAKIRLLKRVKKRLNINYGHFMDSLEHKLEK